MVLLDLSSRYEEEDDQQLIYKTSANPTMTSDG